MTEVPLQAGRRSTDEGVVTHTTAAPSSTHAPADRPADAGPVVELRGVGRRFGEVTALADLDLVVPRQSITVLLGPNGAGKTTAVRMITGALDPDAGVVRVF